MPGPRRRAISTPRLLLTDPAPPAAAPQLRSSSRWRCRRGRGLRAAAAAGAGAEMAERSAARRRQARRHPDRRRERSRRFAVAIGIGVNCAHHPRRHAPIRRPICRAPAPRVDAEALFAALVGAMARRLAQWDAARGFAAIRAEWLARAAGIGGDIRVRLPDRELSGRVRSARRDAAACCADRRQRWTRHRRRSVRRRRQSFGQGRRR